MKKIATLFLTLAMLLSLVACGGETTNSGGTNGDNTTDTSNQTTPSEPDSEPPSHSHTYTQTVTEPTCTTAGFTTYACDCGDTYTDDEIPAKGHSYSQGVCSECGADDPNYVPPPLAIADGETVLLENICEFSADFSKITRKVIPPNPSRFYSYYEADDGKTYVDFCISYKNLDTNSIKADKVANAKLIYAGKYEYSGISIIEEDSRGDFTYTNITSIAPLSTEYVHFLFELPIEAQSSTGSLEILLTVHGNTYSYIVREGDSSTGITNADTPQDNPKTDGELSVKETVVLANTCSFFVDYSNLTKKVTPLQPTSYYRYYEADSDKIYLDFCVGYQNLSVVSIGADDVMSAKVFYDGRYEFIGFSIIEEDSRGDFTYSNITFIWPLAIEYIHYLFELPADVEADGKSLTISFTIGGNTYTHTVQ